MPAGTQPGRTAQAPEGADLVSRIHARRLRRRRYRIPLTVNIAPLIDMSFTMLIFFLVTTRFEHPEGILAARLPGDSGQSLAPAVPLPISPVVIRITQTGDNYDTIAISVDHFAGAPRDFEALPAFMREIRQQPGFDAQTPVVIVADDDVRWDHVVNCWNAALRAGYEKIAFAEP